jgi:amino acid permease
MAVTFTALWPLCNLSSLAALAPFSAVGIVGVLVTCGFMAFRCLSPSSPYALPTGAFLPVLAPALRPSFGTTYNLLSPSSLILASISASAFLAHYLAPDFYHVLGGKDSNNIMGKFRRLVIFGFGGVCLINVAIMAFGFLTFGGNCSGIILNNYSTADMGATICRLLMALCVIGGFPFLINASRSTFLQLTGQNGNLLCWSIVECKANPPHVLVAPDLQRMMYQRFLDAK